MSIEVVDDVCIMEVDPYSVESVDFLYLFYTYKLNVHVFSII